MRIAAAAIFVVVLHVTSLAGDAADEPNNPFDGWTQKRVAEHRDHAARTLRGQSDGQGG